VAGEEHARTGRKVVADTEKLEGSRVVTNGIQHLTVTFDLNGVQRIINPTLIWDGNSAVLVDAGFPGQAPAVRAAIESTGIPFSRLRTIVVTHLDWDHIGGLAKIVADVPGIDVLAHEQEKPFIQGDETFIKSPQRNATGPAPTFTVPDFARTKVTKQVGDGDVLEVSGGVDIIHTPGHTLGHICLYHRQSRTLIAGDALNVVEDKLVGPNPLYTHDLNQATESLKKLAKYDICTVICYHGGVFTDDPNHRIAELSRGEQ
jgi:glyoxylase-like metal-dependent hydrolase (beta-lactamase superfamily II)